MPLVLDLVEIGASVGQDLAQQGQQPMPSGHGRNGYQSDHINCEPSRNVFRTGDSMSV